ncbi:hypothetical protein ACSBR2_034748 [Camellia fascicularis]
MFNAFVKVTCRWQYKCLQNKSLEICAERARTSRLTLSSLMTFLGPFISKHCDWRLEMDVFGNLESSSLLILCFC